MQDSSQIINDVLSSYQRSLLEMIFMKDADNRSKFNLITRCTPPPSNSKMRANFLTLQLTSDSITPKLPHEK